MMDNETLEDFARYRLKKAKETLHTAEFVFNEVKDYTKYFGGLKNAENITQLIFV